MAVVLGDSFGAIGDIKQSMLTLAQFQAAYGAGWVIADGSSCTGTKYASISGNSTLPDCRGYFLRGKDNGAGHNPNGEQSLGEYQGDNFASHSHTEYYCNNSGSGITGWAGGTYNPGQAASSLTTGAVGGSETAPKTVTVNLFIRIN